MVLAYARIFRRAAWREGFVLDFCPTFRILSFVMSGKNLRSPFTKQLTGLFCKLRSNPYLYSRQSKKGTPFGVPSCFGGERGIRTLVCVSTNWFRVSPVMTTSISLQILTKYRVAILQRWYYIIKNIKNQYFFWKNKIFFEKYYYIKKYR